MVGGVSARVRCTTYSPTITHRAVRDSSMMRLGDSPVTTSVLLLEERLRALRLIQGVNMSAVINISYATCTLCVLQAIA